MSERSRVGTRREQTLFIDRSLKKNGFFIQIDLCPLFRIWLHWHLYRQSKLICLLVSQIDKIIKDSTNIDNLALLYEGWTPWVWKRERKSRLGINLNKQTQNGLNDVSCWYGGFLLSASSSASSRPKNGYFLGLSTANSGSGDATFG